MHPLGKAPIITDGDLTLAESGAIIGISSSLSTWSANPPFYRVSHRQVRKRARKAPADR